MQEAELMVMAPFESASELQEAHTSLLEALDRQIGPETTADNATAALTQLETQVRQFLERGAATGIYLQDISDRTSCQVLLDYWVSSLSHAGLKVTGTRLARFDALKLPDLKDKSCPYVGLDAFRNQDFFFGREADTQQLLSQVKQAPLVIVLGASGSGKSSLVMGGVLPALTAPAAGSQLIIIPPFVPGNTVLDGLATAVMQVRPSGGNHAREVEQLRQTPSHLSLMLGGADAPSTLVIIDQFEEIFTLTPPTDREALIANLAQLLESGRGHHVILTVREEFRSRIVELHALSPNLDKAWYSMRPMSYGELKATVEGPAAMVNLQFQSGIVDDLVKNVLGQPAALPLLQFTLRSLWEKRDRNRITREVYQKIGDPLNALAKSADEFFDHLAPQTKDETKRILLELVRVDELLEAYRQPVLQSRLMEPGKANTREVIALLDKNDYIRITPNADGTDGVIEVKHESLIRNWPRFVAWIDEKRVQRRQRLILTQAAKRWVQDGKPQEGLLTGWQLREANQYFDILDRDEQHYVAASTEATEEKQREEEATQFKIRLRRVVIATLSIVLIIAIASALYLDQTRKQAESAQRHAENAQRRAEELLGFLLGEQFLGKIRDVGNSSMLEQVRGKVESYLEGSTQSSAHNRGLHLRNTGDLERMHGNTQKSLDHFEGALQALFSSRESPERDREIARTYDRIGEALTAQGQVTQALDRYLKAVEAWRRVIENKAVVEVTDCISFADSLLGVGELKHRTGKTTAAIRHLTEALGSITTVPFGGCGPTASAEASYPTVDALVVLSRGLMLRTALFNEEEDFNGAVQLAKEATRLSPASISAKKQASTALANLANSQFFTNPQAALIGYRERLAEFDLLLHHDPTHSLWRREHAILELLIARATVACHETKAKCHPRPPLEEAEIALLKGTSVLRALGQDDPHDVSLQRDLGLAFETGATIPAAKHQHNERLQALIKAAQIYKGTILDPTDAEGALALGAVYLHQSRAFADLEKWEDAETFIGKSASLYEAYDKTIENPTESLSILSALIEAQSTEVDILRMRRANVEAHNRAELAQQTLKALQDLGELRYDTLSKTSYPEATKRSVSYDESMKKGTELLQKGEHPAALHEFEAAASAMQEYIQLLPRDSYGYDALRHAYKMIQSVEKPTGNAPKANTARKMMVDMARIASLLASQANASSLNDTLRQAYQIQGSSLFKSPDFKNILSDITTVNLREIAYAEDALRQNPNNAESLRNLSNAYYGKGLISREAHKEGWEEAFRISIVYLQKATAINSKNPQYPKELGENLKYLAERLYADGQKEKALAEFPHALAAYKKAARLSPEDKEIRDAIKDLNSLGIR